MHMLDLTVPSVLLGNVEVGFFILLTLPATRTVVSETHGQHNKFLIEDHSLINLNGVLPKHVMKCAGKRNVAVLLGNL